MMSRLNAYSGGVLARALPEGLRYLSTWAWLSSDKDWARTNWNTQKQAVSPFALMMMQLDSLDLNAWHSRAFPFLVAKHCSGHSFQLRDYPLPTVELIPELQQFLCHCPRQFFTNV